LSVILIRRVQNYDVWIVDVRGEQNLFRRGEERGKIRGTVLVTCWHPDRRALANQYPAAVDDEPDPDLVARLKSSSLRRGFRITRTPDDLLLSGENRHRHRRPDVDGQTISGRSIRLHRVESMSPSRVEVKINSLPLGDSCLGVIAGEFSRTEIRGNRGRVFDPSAFGR